MITLLFTRSSFRRGNLKAGHPRARGESRDPLDFAYILSNKGFESLQRLITITATMGVLSRITDEGLLSRFSAEGLLLRFAELDILRQAAYEHRVAIALTGVGLYVLRKLRAYWRLRHIKGPFSTGFFGLWHTRAIVGYESHKVYKNATDRYGMYFRPKVPRLANANDHLLGPLVRIGPNSLLTSDTDLWLHINSARSDYSRAAWFNLSARFQPGRDTVVSQVDEVKHKARRAQVAPGVRYPPPYPLRKRPGNRPS